MHRAKRIRVLVGKHEGKRPDRIPKNSREANTKMDLKEISWEGVRWINVAHDVEE
jgi:hypothetical protein